MLVVILMTFSVVKIGKKYENENVNDNFFSFLNANLNLNPSLDDNLSTLTINH